MKKLWKKIVCIALAAVTVFPVAACGKPKRPRSETLTITVSNLGFGTAWLDAIAKEFENAYNVSVVVTPTIIQGSLLTQLETGYQLDDLCMFAGVSAVWDTMRKGKFMEIDDVWSSTVDGESKTIAEKALPELAEAYKFQNHYYSMPFITEMGGMAYNKTTLDKLYGAGNWTLPTTTGELNEMCADIVSKGAYPFVWSNKENSCYWGMTAEAWTAQYDGVKAYAGAGRASYWDETKNDYVLADTVEVAKEKILSNKGRYYVYDVGYNYTRGDYSHKYSTSMTFSEAQLAFAGGGYANDKKLCVFSNNGDWLYEESQDDFVAKRQNIGFMKVPVTSALVEKLSFYAAADGTWDKLSAEKKTKYDKVLRAIIAYVDGKTETKPTEVEGFAVTDADIDRVAEARGVVYIKDQAHAFIPTNSQNPELAKKFLKFFASDYAGSIYQSVTHGLSPFYYALDENALDENNKFTTDFDRDVSAMLNSATHRVGADSRFGFYLSRRDLEANSTESAEQSYQWYIDTNTKTTAGGNAWVDRLINAGLKIQ